MESAKIDTYLGQLEDAIEAARYEAWSRANDKAYEFGLKAGRQGHVIDMEKYSEAEYSEMRNAFWRGWCEGVRLKPTAAIAPCCSAADKAAETEGSYEPLL